LLEMVRGSGVSAVIEAGSVPFLPGTAEHAASGIAPGGSVNNLEYTKPHVRYPEKLSDLKRLLLNDAQTSGGLLISVARERSEQMKVELEARGVKEATLVGRIIPEAGSRVLVE
jgi:selenophosphate synthase